MIDDNDPLRQCKHALALAERGLPVFPIREGAKFPPVFENFSERATTNPAIIREWWPEGSRLNIGIATGNGLLAMDYDCKGDQRGLLLKEIYESDHDLPETLEFQTGSDGIHALYETPAILEVPNRKSIEGPGSGVDVRAFHGYIVAPGSIVDGKKYTILHDRPIADMPAEFLDQRIIKHRPRGTPGSATLAPIGELDTSAAIDKARAWLIEDAPKATEGAGGDTTTYAVACRVKDFGISEGECLGLMLDFWNAEKAFPAWDPEDLERKVSNAYQYGQEPPGSKNYAGAFEPVDLEEEEGGADRPRGFHVLSEAESVERATTQATEPLIEGMLSRRTVSVLYGESNVGKTFVALDMVQAIASGRDWNGRPVEKTPVLYVAAEAGAGIHKRVAALRDRHGASGGLFVAPCGVDLTSGPKDRKAIVEAARERGVGLIVIDTLSRALAGGDENSPVHMGQLIRNVDRIVAETGASVMLVHHAGKDTSKGARGHSILRAAVDTEFEIVEGRLKTRKQRDMEMAEPMAFHLVQATVGIDDSGREITSCTVAWGGVSAADAFEPELSERAAKMMDEMQLQTGESIATGALVALLRLHHSSDSENTLRSEVRRIGAELVQIGYFEKGERGQWVRTEKPWVGAHGASDGAG